MDFAWQNVFSILWRITDIKERTSAWCRTELSGNWSWSFGCFSSCNSYSLRIPGLCSIAAPLERNFHRRLSPRDFSPSYPLSYILTIFRWLYLETKNNVTLQSTYIDFGKISFFHIFNEIETSHYITRAKKCLSFRFLT